MEPTGSETSVGSSVGRRGSHGSPSPKKKLLRRSSTEGRSPNNVKQLSTITIMYNEDGPERFGPGAGTTVKEHVKTEEQMRREVIAFSDVQGPFLGLQASKTTLEKQSLLLDLGDDDRLAGLHAAEPDQIMKRFRDTNIPDLIDKPQLGDAMRAFKVGDRPILDRLFVCFDQEDAGVIDWRDLLSTIIMFRPLKPDEKLEKIWKVWDKSGTGEHSRADVIKLMKISILATEGRNAAENVVEMIYHVLNYEADDHKLTIEDVVQARSLNMLVDEFIKKFYR